MNREAIYSALFALVSTAPGLATSSRKLLHWNDVPASQRPALFLAQKGETAVQSTGMPTKWLLDLDLYVYVSTVGATAPGTVLNPIVDAIAAKLDNGLLGYPQRLGGLVEYARIEGRIETDEGTLGDDAVAIIPVRILTTAEPIAAIVPVPPAPTVFTPASLSLSVWYRNSELATQYQTGSRASPGAAVASGDPVGVLLDKSGNNKDILSVNNSARPLANTANGITKSVFDGVDDRLGNEITPILSDFISASEFDLLIAGVFTSSDTDSAIHYYQNRQIFAEFVGPYLAVGCRSSGKLGIELNGNGTIAEVTYTVGQPFVLHARLFGGNLSLTLDNGTPSTVASTNVGSLIGPVRYGGGYTSLYMNGGAHGLISRKTVFTAPELANLKTYLAADQGRVL